MPNFILFALASAAVMVPAGAKAQLATFCDDRIVASAFYGTPQGGYGSRTTVVFYVRLQNRTNEGILFRVRFYHLDAQSLQNGSTVTLLPPWQPVTLRLGHQALDDPSEALSPTDLDEGVPHYTQVTCAR